MYTRVKSDAELENMRESGRMNAAVLSYIEKNTQAGMTTNDVNDLAERELAKLGGKPAFLNYEGFPKSLCASINDEIVHGIPSERLLQDGDLVTFDFGVIYKGMITDSAFTMVVGGKFKDAKSKMLVETTKRAMFAGIDKLKDGVKIGDIAAAIEGVLAGKKLGIVREFVGHGVGHHLHEEPNIPNYGQPGTGPVLKAGMTVAIEPMAMLGAEGIAIADDGWTVATADQSLSAHFEHTVLITNDGSEILT